MSGETDDSVPHSKHDFPGSDRVRPRVLMYSDMSETGHSKEDHYYAAEVASAFSTDHVIRPGTVVPKESLGYAEFPPIERIGTHHDLESFVEEVEAKADHVAWKDGVTDDD